MLGLVHAETSSTNTWLTDRIPALNNNPIDIIGASWASAFSANIAQVQIYNRALTAAEISQNYNALRNRFGL